MSRRQSLLKVVRVFDPAVGYQQTSADCYTDGVHSDKTTWAYVQQDDVCLPKQYTMQRFNEDGQVTLARDIELQRSVLNGELPEGTFSYARFAPADGDRVVDKIDEKRYVFRDGRMLSPDEYLASEKAQ